jgi:hypothetical protein
LVALCFADADFKSAAFLPPESGPNNDFKGDIMRKLLLLLLMPLVNFRAYAQGPCDEALVKSTYNSFSSDHLDWRLASQVTEKTYDEIKHDAGANAVIYGFPVGATYDDFQKRVKESSNTFATSLTHDQALNIMWTGLDPNAPSVYSACLQAKVLASRGLHAVVKSATNKDIAIILRWVPQGSDPSSIKPTWVGITKDIDGNPLSKNLTQGQTVVVVGRPSVERTLAVNYPGFGDSITLEPLPPIPPPLKPVYVDESLSTDCVRDRGQMSNDGVKIDDKHLWGLECPAPGPVTSIGAYKCEGGKPCDFLDRYATRDQIHGNIAYPKFKTNSGDDLKVTITINYTHKKCIANCPK